MPERTSIYSDEEVAAARDLVRELVRTVRAFRLYDGDHPTLERMVEQLLMRWVGATVGGSVCLRMTPKQILLEEGAALYEITSRNEIVPTVLYDHGVVGLVLLSGMEIDELRRLCGILATEPGPQTDYGTLLWEGHLLHVKVLLDSDEFEGGGVSHDRFGEEISKLGDDEDPEIGEQYEQEREEIAPRPADAERDEGHEAEEAEPQRDLFMLTDGEQRRLMRMIQQDNSINTVRHAMRVVHALSREDLTADEVEPLESATRGLVGMVAQAGDFEGALEMLDRAHFMRNSDHTLEMHLGELCYATFLDPENLRRLLRCVDERTYVDARDLGDLLALLGPAASNEVAQWLIETEHDKVVIQGLRLYGDDAAHALVPLYEQGSPEARKRIGEALLAIGTPEALAALSSEFGNLPEASRLQLLKAMTRNPEPSLRRVVIESLYDPAERIRRTALESVRKADADAMAEVLRDLFLQEVFEQRSDEEVADFFEVMSRIANRAVAEVLAERCMAKGLRRAFMKLTPLQHHCLRALRRMRDPEARRIVAHLKANGSRAVRDVLEDPLPEF